MALHRFWLSPLPRLGHSVPLAPEESQHVRKALRLGAGDEITVWDGDQSARAQVQEIRKGEVWVKLKEYLESPEPKLPEVTLYAPLIKQDRFEWMLEKVTELGVDTIIPTLSEFSQVNMKTAIAKRGRWERILRETSKQCQRPRLPALSDPVHLHDVLPDLENMPKELNLMAALPGEIDVERKAEKDLPQAQSALPLSDTVKNLSGFSMVRIFIGPEGGFSPSEIGLAFSAPVKFVDLGRNILRSETAAITAAGVILLAR